MNKISQYSIIAIKRMAEIAIASTNSLSTTDTEVVTYDLSSFGFGKIPKVFISETFLCSVTVEDLTTTSISVRFYNLWATNQKVYCGLTLMEMYSLDRV